MRRFRRLDHVGVVAGLLFAVFAGVTVLWLILGRVPPNWDDAWYLTNSLFVYDALTNGGVAGFFARLNTVFGFKAPLIAALPAPFYLLLGRRWHAAFFVNVVSMGVLFWALFRIARRWWGRRPALFAIAIAGTMPLLYGLARWYLVEYPLAALVALAIWLLLESDGLKRRNTVLLFGVACGFGLLLKLAFALFITPAFLYVWGRSRNRLRSFILAAIPCLVLAGPWYAGHLLPTIKNGIAAGFGISATVQGMGPIFSPHTISVYLSRVAVNGVSTYYAALTVLLMAWTMRHYKGRALLRSLLNGPYRALLLLWLLPFLLFVFGGNKDIRYIAPTLPAFALLLASLLDFILPRNTAGSVMAVLVLAFPMCSLFAVSFGIPFRTPNLTYTRCFARTQWPHDEILRVTAASSHPKLGERERILVGVDRATLNANNIELSVTARQLPFTVETTAYEDDLNIVFNRLDQASYFLYEEGGSGESAFNQHTAELINRVAAARQFTEIPYGRRLPDGGVVRIFKNSAASRPFIDASFVEAGSPLAEEFHVDFGGMLMLTSLSTSKTAEAISVGCHWRCL